MANQATKTSAITLIDGTSIDAKPLKISLLKPFMEKFGEMAAVAEDNNKSIDILLDCVQITLQQYKPELAEDREALENNIDLPTMYKLIEAASGIQLADPATIISALNNKN